jgi:FAD/FMN-containing dehydrogenase
VVFQVMPAPPMPFIPAELHGQLVVMVMPVFAGDPAAAERAVAPFRALAQPLADLLQPMPYPAIYQAHEGAPHPAAVAFHSGFGDAFDLDSAAAALERLRAGTAPMRVAQFRPLGGAVARVPSADTAFAHRERKFILNIAAMYADPGEAAVQDAWVAAAVAELDRVFVPGAYSGFLGRDGSARIGEAYPGATGERLADIKRRYDPTNLFRGNHNIVPA